MLVILSVIAALLLLGLLLWGRKAQEACDERERQAAAERLEPQRREADALGAAEEFCRRDIFEPLTGMRADEYFKLPTGRGLMTRRWRYPLGTVNALSQGRFREE